MNTSKSNPSEEKKAVPKNKSAKQNAIKNIQSKRKKIPDTQSLVKEITKGNITALSQAITLIESNNTNHQEQADRLLKACLPYANNALRIGITGVPGVGKSTFIEAFGKHLTTAGKKVAVLAVDPSSSISKGSILGDKTRMQELVKDPNAYIRPSPSGDSLGGVAKKTRESIILCEAAGFNILLIETVGVGQSETAVHSMVDFFLLLKLAGAGDELQGIKRGIMEMADLIAINKADKENIKNAKLAQVEFQRALHLYPPKDSGWQPKVMLCSALENKGISEIWKTIESFFEAVCKTHYFSQNRMKQNKFWLLETINQNLKSNFYNHPKIKKELPKQMQLLEENKTTPFAAASYLLNLHTK